MQRAALRSQREKNCRRGKDDADLMNCYILNLKIKFHDFDLTSRHVQSIT